MHDLRYYKVMADYNHWMNLNLYTVCADVPDPIRKEDRGAFFKSIHTTLNHLLLTDRIWLMRFRGQPLPNQKLNQDLYTDFDELRREREKTDLDLQTWVNNLTVEWLKQPFSFTSKSDGKTRTLPAWVLVVHLFNHQTHHRGQVTTLLSQLGYDYGTTDLPWLPSLNAVD